MYVKSVVSMVAVATWILAVGVSAGEAAPNDWESRAKKLEERVNQLEKKIAEMEGNEGRVMKTPSVRKNFNFKNDDFERFLDEARKRMMDNNDGFGFEMPPIPNLEQNFPGMGRVGRKPSLGVGVDEISDELKTRFKNEVKEGAFVMNVFPHSPADSAGIKVGDAITTFDDKPITTPKALIEAVKNAAPGAHDIMLSRHGELLKFKVELNAPDAPGHAEKQLDSPGAGGDMTSRTELKVSALELSDGLAKELKLDDTQRTKVREILAKHAKALSIEVANEQPKGNRRSNGFGFTMNNQINEQAKKHTDAAAADLVGVLNDEQMKKWNDYRVANSSISFSQSMQLGKSFPRTEPKPKLKTIDPDDDGPVKF